MQAETVVEAVPALADVLARRVAETARRALAERGRCALVLSGGSVAESLLPGLADAGLDWPRVDVFWGDERAVPPDHADSNYALARRGLLDRVSARVHRMRAEALDLAVAAADYERLMREALGEAPRLDIALLGMGPDGHVCSLFPGHAALRERARWVVPIEDSPKPPSARLTLTLAALALTDLLIVGAWGRAKAEAVRQVLREPESSLPAALVARGARSTLFLLDEEAARGLA